MTRSAAPGGNPGTAQHKRLNGKPTRRQILEAYKHNLGEDEFNALRAGDHQRYAGHYVSEADAIDATRRDQRELAQTLVAATRTHHVRHTGRPAARRRGAGRPAVARRTRTSASADSSDGPAAPEPAIGAGPLLAHPAAGRRP